MDDKILLLLGCALVLAGVFGLVEVAIRHRRQPLVSSGPAEDARPAPIPPTDEELEIVVVREREVNPDGRPRQEIIKDLQVGDPVGFLLERQGPDGRGEIRVHATGGTIGYVPSGKVPRLLDLLNEGAETHSEVSHVAGPDGVRSVWINVWVWR